MKVIEQNKSKITIEFDLLDFDSLKEFFKEQKQAVENTGKFEYEAIQKLLEIEFEDSTFVNDMRLKRIKYMFEENEKLLAKHKAKN